MGNTWLASFFPSTFGHLSIWSSLALKFSVGLSCELQSVSNWSTLFSWLFGLENSKSLVLDRALWKLSMDSAAEKKLAADWVDPTEARGLSRSRVMSLLGQRGGMLMGVLGIWRVLLESLRFEAASLVCSLLLAFPEQISFVGHLLQT